MCIVFLSGARFSPLLPREEWIGEGEDEDPFGIFFGHKILVFVAFYIQNRVPNRSYGTEREMDIDKKRQMNYNFERLTIKK